MFSLTSGKPMTSEEHYRVKYSSQDITGSMKADGFYAAKT